MSVKQARKQERARMTKRTSVMGRVAESHVPFCVNTGMRSWKAMRVPVGKRLAKVAVVDKVWEIALCERDCWRWSWGFGVSSGSGSVLVVVLGVLGVDGGFVVGVGLGLRLDIIWVLEKMGKVEL